jgi:dTDP-glucose 4,6-dehydratase
MGKEEEMIGYVKDRPGHDLRYAINFSKAEKELDWRPRVAFESGLEKTIEWYRENQDWWHKIKRITHNA